MRGRFGAAALAVAVALGGSPALPADAQHAAVTPGYQVPEFSAQAVDGSTRRVAFEKGTATVLLFFLSSCPTCHKQIPDWNRCLLYTSPSPRDS